MFLWLTFLFLFYPLKTEVTLCRGIYNQQRDEGENVISLYIDASSGTGWWYEGGGLMRHNYLVATSSAVHLRPGQGSGAWAYADGISVEKKTATLQLNAAVVNSKGIDYQIKFIIYDEDEKTIDVIKSGIVAATTTEIQMSNQQINFETARIGGMTRHAK